MATGKAAQLIEQFEEELDYYGDNDRNMYSLEIKWDRWDVNDIGGMIKFAVEHPQLAACDKIFRLKCLRDDINLIGNEMKLSGSTRSMLEELAFTTLTIAGIMAIDGDREKAAENATGFINGEWEKISAEMKKQFFSSIFKLL